MNRPDFDILLTAALPDIEQAAQHYAQRYNMGDEWRDIAQDVVLRLLTYSDHYDPDKGNMLQWSARMIIHRLCERYNERINKPLITDYNDTALLKINSDTDIYSDLQAAYILDNLNREARLYYEGYNLAEISHMISKAKSTVVNRLNANVAKLRAATGYKGTVDRRRGNERPGARRFAIVAHIP